MNNYCVSDILLPIEIVICPLVTSHHFGYAFSMLISQKSVLGLYD